MEQTIRPSTVPYLAQPWTSDFVWARQYLLDTEYVLRAPLWWTPGGVVLRVET